MTLGLPCPRPGESLRGARARHDEVVEDRLGAALYGVDEEADAVELTPTRLVLGSNKRLAVHREREDGLAVGRGDALDSQLVLLP